MKNLTAVIPVRQGSQRVKNKNFREFAGKSLLEYKIDVVKNLSVDEIIINTDKQEATKVTLIRIIRRSMRSERKPTGHWKIAPKVLTITIKIEISKVLSPFVIA